VIIGAVIIAAVASTACVVAELKKHNSIAKQ